MLTELGKILRKIRIDNQHLLKDMADILKVSPAYLSAVENGKRKAPTDWVEKIIGSYKLKDDDAENLRCAYENSQQEIKLSLQMFSAQQKEAAVSFAKVLEGLSDEELKEIMKIVKKHQ